MVHLVICARLLEVSKSHAKPRHGGRHYGVLSTHCPLYLLTQGCMNWLQLLPLLTLPLPFSDVHAAASSKG